MNPKQNDKDAPGDRKPTPGKGQPESPESIETFAKREERPGSVGLANEVRPGLGTRAEEEAERNDPGTDKKKKKSVHDLGKPKATPYGYEEPRPEPREQEPNSRAHEEERSTSASGQMGNG